MIIMIQALVLQNAPLEPLVVRARSMKIAFISPPQLEQEGMHILPLRAWE